MLHKVGVLFDLYYDVWKHKSKIYDSLVILSVGMPGRTLGSLWTLILSNNILTTTGFSNLWCFILFVIYNLHRVSFCLIDCQCITSLCVSSVIGAVIAELLKWLGYRMDDRGNVAQF